MMLRALMAAAMLGVLCCSLAVVFVSRNHRGQDSAHVSLMSWQGFFATKSPPQPFLPAISKNHPSTDEAMRQMRDMIARATNTPIYSLITHPHLAGDPVKTAVPWHITQQQKWQQALTGRAPTSTVNEDSFGHIMGTMSTQQNLPAQLPSPAIHHHFLSTPPVSKNVDISVHAHSHPMNQAPLTTASDSTAAIVAPAKPPTNPAHLKRTVNLPNHADPSHSPAAAVVASFSIESPATAVIAAETSTSRSSSERLERSGSVARLAVARRDAARHERIAQERLSGNSLATRKHSPCHSDI